MKPVFDNFTGPQTDRRKFLLGLLFCSAAGIAAARRPTKRIDYLGREKLEDLVPKSIGKWDFVTASGLVVPPNDELSKALYSEVLTRAYSDGENPPIMLLLAQNGSQSGFLQVHRPEICYAASGYQISAAQPYPLKFGSKTLVANSMDASNGSATEHIIYWIRIGNTVPTSWRAQKLAVAEQNLEGIIPDAILVRVSCVSNDADAARGAIGSFIQALVQSVAPSKRSVFIA